MKFSTILLIAFNSLFLSCNSSNNLSKESKLDSTCIPVIETFFNKIQANNDKGALEDLLSSNTNIDQKDSTTILMKIKFAAINQFSGAFRGKSLIKKRIINDDISIYSYLAKYDKRFYRFVFVF